MPSSRSVIDDAEVCALRVDCAVEMVDEYLHRSLGVQVITTQGCEFFLKLMLGLREPIESTLGSPPADSLPERLDLSCDLVCTSLA